MKNNMLLYKFLGPFENFNLKSEEIYYLQLEILFIIYVKKKFLHFKINAVIDMYDRFWKSHFIKCGRYY